MNRAEIYMTKNGSNNWRVSVHRFLLEFWYNFKLKQKITNIFKDEHPRKRLKRRRHRRKRARWWPRKRHRLIRNHHQRHLGRHSIHAPFCIINLFFFFVALDFWQEFQRRRIVNIAFQAYFRGRPIIFNVSGVRHRSLIKVLSSFFHKFFINFYIIILSFLINF